MTHTPTIRDLAYLDVPKATSLYSQITGGLTTEIQSGVARGSEERNIRRYKLPFIEPEFGGTSTKTTSHSERRILHHDLLRRLEKVLFDNSFAVDLNSRFERGEATLPLIRRMTSHAYYIRVEGWPVLEDYRRIQHAVGEFNKLADFINRCNTYEFERLENKLDELLDEARDSDDPKQRATMEHYVKTQRQALEKEKQEAQQLGGLDAWLVEGIQHWIDTFMAGRINLRVFPFQETPEFQVIANLKQECFVGATVDDLLFAYGQEPDVKLTVTGLVTSQPPEDEDELFDTLQQYNGDEDELDEIGEEEDEDIRRKEFEGAFRSVFSALAGLEDFSRFSRYPNVTVFPLAVYRSVQAESTPKEGHRAGDEQSQWWKFWR